LSLFSQKAVKYFAQLKSPSPLHENINVLNPYSDKDVRRIVNEFYHKFFKDANERTFILGINPGRFGGGITGIAFTDPVALQEYCGIRNNFIKKRELSSKFVYSFIEDYGGVNKFFSKFFISAVYPLALLKDGKNYNYYDSSTLYRSLKPHILSSLKAQIKLGAKEDIVICLGKKNANYLREINKKLSYFKKIVILDHPRYVMQYKLKKIDEYIKKYMSVLRSC
jgi:hypothetical protein